MGDKSSPLNMSSQHQGGRRDQEEKTVQAGPGNTCIAPAGDATLRDMLTATNNSSPAVRTLAPRSVAAPVTENSQIGRFVAFFTPVFAAGAGWAASYLAIHAGIKLDPAQVTAFMVVVATSALTAALKFLHGWQLHEQRVANGTAAPLHPAAAQPTTIQLSAPTEPAA
jgi:hypothetical protein